jgi:GDPmannose 4,6-dehydratase
VNAMGTKKSIIVGHAGQDGRLLVGDLQKRGDEIIGIGRESCLLPVGFSPDVMKDITNAQEVREVVRLFQPDEIYYLAAYHVSSEAGATQTSLHKQFESAQAIHVTGLVNCLSAIVDKSPNTRLFYASSSLVFSGENGARQDETTPLTPQEFYGITKAQGMWLCQEFRKKHYVFASTGILYNHESHLRAPNFLSAKIIRTAIRISEGSGEKLEIGNLAGRVDWGYAKDYVLAFQKILTADSPDDFIVATDESHTVKEFIDIVFKYFNLNPDEYVVENKNILTRKPPVKIGDASKLRGLTGWKQSMNYKDFVIQLAKDHQTAGRLK